VDAIPPKVLMPDIAPGIIEGYRAHLQVGGGFYLEQ